jgi:hypothetical protein
MFKKNCSSVDKKISTVSLYIVYLFGCAEWYTILHCYVKITALLFNIVQRSLTVLYNR